MDKSTFGATAYIPGMPAKNPEPLARYLPPIPDGVISTWVQNNISRGSWILDPFCTSPRIAIEAAQAGYRVLVTANNPISRFLLEMAAQPPKADDLQSSLAVLAASYKGEERIEPHIRSLYSTYCARCGQMVSAEAFLWEHGNPAPYMRVYTCPYCGDTGEHPCTPHDAAQVSQFQSGGLHRARALERVVAFTDQDRIHVEQALSVYIPRALYALITIINKVEGLNISTSEQKHLAALLLFAFDQATAMWRVPNSRERRRQLTIPKHFCEVNIWMALEQGIDIWSTRTSLAIPPAIPISIWPEKPPEQGGICIYDGRLSAIADSLSGLKIEAACATIPRPNQAYWTLSALWAGWLWGREAVGSIKGVLHRQRFDWGWHTNALASVFKQLVNILEPSTPIFGLIGEAEPGFIAATLIAAGFAGCRLEGLALRTDENQAQIMWRSQRNHGLSLDDTPLIELAAIGAKKYLETRGEPASYLNTISAALSRINQPQLEKTSITVDEKKSKPETPEKAGESSEASEPTPSFLYSSIYNTAKEALSYRSGFLRYNIQDLANADTTLNDQIIQDTLFSLDIRKTDDNVDDSITTESQPGQWESSAEKERPTRSSEVTESILLWLRDTDNLSHFPITDTYEQFLVNYFTNHQNCTIDEIDVAMCREFTGLYTPDHDFIQMCLESYGERDVNSRNRWQLRAEDDSSKRQDDLANAKKYIRLIGDRLRIQSESYQMDSQNDEIIWIDKIGELDYWFYPIITAALGEIVIFGKQPPRRGFIIIPGSRANIMIYKLRRDPRLSRAFNPTQGSWRFLKFRHLRSLVDNPLLTRENIDQLFSLDPLTYSTPQLRMI